MAKARGMGLATRGAGATGKDMAYKGGGSVVVKGYKRGGPVKSSFKMAKPKVMGSQMADEAKSEGEPFAVEKAEQSKGYKKGGVVTGKIGSGQASMPGYKSNAKGVGYKVPDQGKMTKDARKLSKQGTVEPKKSNAQ